MVTERSNLRLSDLKARMPEGSCLMNVKVPVDTLAAIDRLANELNATKTSVVVALLQPHQRSRQRRYKRIASSWQFSRSTIVCRHTARRGTLGVARRDRSR